MVDIPRLTPQGDFSRRGELPVVRPNDVSVPRFSNMGSPDLSAINATIGNYSQAASYYESAKNSYLGLAQDIKAEREAAERKQKELILAQLKAQAVRRATEIEVQNFNDVDGFDKTYGAYSRETLAKLSPDLRAEAAISLMNVGTSSAGSILGRVRAQEEAIHKLTISESYETELDSIVNTIHKSGNFETELPRIDELKNSIIGSTISIEAKKGLLDDLENRTRGAVLLRIAEEHYTSGNYDFTLQSLLDAMDNTALGEGLGEDEKYKLAADTLNKITPLERQRAAAETEAEKTNNKVKDANYESFIDSLIAHKADPKNIPKPTIQDLSDLDMKPGSKARAYEMLTAKDDIVTDPEVMRTFRNLKRQDPEAAFDFLNNAWDDGKINIDDFLTADKELDVVLQREGKQTPLATERDTLEKVLSEGTMSGDPTLASRTAEAVKELEIRSDEIAASLPGGVEDPEYSTKLRQEREKIQSRYGLINIQNMRLNLPLPEGFYGNRSDVTIEVIELLEDKLMKEIDSLDGSQAERRIEDLQRWRDLLEQEKRLNNERANGQ